jgi:4-amino-4-deoxy-L-arabinose transferase-like glycosyltransferase
MKFKPWVLANKEILIAVLLAALFLLPALNFGLWEPWEPRYAQAVVEMGEQGNYLTPYYRGQPRFSPQILPYWSIAVSYAVFGVNEVATRLPFVLFAVASIGVLVHTLSRLFNTYLGLLAGLVLLTSPMFSLLSRQAIPDALFNANLTMALCFFALGLFETEGRNRRMTLFYVFSALAVLAHGPLGLVIIGSIVGSYLLFTLDYAAGSARAALTSLGRFLVRDMRIHWGALVFLAIAAPWYIYSAVTTDGFLGLLWTDHLERFGRGDGAPGGGIAAYVEALAYGFFPWSVLLPAAGFCLACRPKKSWTDLQLKHLFFGCWFIMPFLIFSAAPVKQGFYVSSVLPALAFLAALFLTTYVLDDERPLRYFAFFIVALGLFLLPARELLRDPAFLFATMTARPAVNEPVSADLGLSDPRTIYYMFFWFFGVTLLFAAVLSPWRLRRQAVVAMTVVAAMFSIYNAQRVFVELTPHKSQKYVIKHVMPMMESSDKLGIYVPGRSARRQPEWPAIEASAIFYTRNRIHELTSDRLAERFFVDQGGTHCIVETKHLQRLQRALLARGYTTDVVDTSHFRYTTIHVSPNEAVSSAPN